MIVVLLGWPSAHGPLSSADPSVGLAVYFQNEDFCNGAKADLERTLADRVKVMCEMIAIPSGATP